MTDGKHTFTPAGRQRRATYVEVCKWVLTAWSKIKPSTIINGFKKCHILTGDVDSSSSDSSDAGDENELNETSLDAEGLDAALNNFLDENDSEFDGFASDTIDSDD
mgnify:FL=1